jgi:7-keto-8-aminopelargonate synthetase-like enzyme
MTLKVWRKTCNVQLNGKETGGGILFITEGVFGMRGQQGKLKEIVAMKEIQFPFIS